MGTLVRVFMKSTALPAPMQAPASMQARSRPARCTYIPANQAGEAWVIRVSQVLPVMPSVSRSAKCAVRGYRRIGCALVHEREAVLYGGAAVEAQEGQRQLIQQPLQHVQRGGPLAEDQRPVALRLWVHQVLNQRCIPWPRAMEAEDLWNFAQQD